MPYLIIYYEVSLSLENYVLIMAPAIIVAGVVTVFYGRLYEKLGFVKSAIPSLALLGVGYVVLSLFTNTILVFIGSLFMMTGYLTGMSVFGAMIRDNTPKTKAGAFQGIRIVGQVLIPGIIGPMIGAFVLRDADKMVGNDGTTSFIPNNKIFIAALIVLAVAIVSVFVIKLVMKKIKKPEKPVENSENNA